MRWRREIAHLIPYTTEHHADGLQPVRAVPGAAGVDESEMMWGRREWDSMGDRSLGRPWMNVTG